MLTYSVDIQYCQCYCPIDVIFIHPVIDNPVTNDNGQQRNYC